MPLTEGTTEADTVAPPRRRRLAWWAWLALGCVAGLVVGRSIPPPYVDGSWVWQFVVSPGFAGSVAFLGATIAALLAWANARADRRQRHLAELRARWWERFTWASEMALDGSSPEVGITVLNSLVSPGLATQDDATMAEKVLDLIVSADDEEVDGEPQVQP